ncbi:hypothetical protein ACOJDJ_000137 [Cronobacter dublinensis]
MAEENKKKRTTYVQDRSKARKARLSPKLNEDTLQMQARYEQEGYKNIAEILFLIANDAFEDLASTLKTHDLHSEEYERSFQRALKAANNAAPYFAKAIRSNVEINNIIEPNNVEDAIKKLLDKK